MSPRHRPATSWRSSGSTSIDNDRTRVGRTSCVAAGAAHNPAKRFLVPLDIDSALEHAHDRTELDVDFALGAAALHGLGQARPRHTSAQPDQDRKKTARPPVRSKGTENDWRNSTPSRSTAAQSIVPRFSGIETAGGSWPLPCEPGAIRVASCGSHGTDANLPGRRFGAPSRRPASNFLLPPARFGRLRRCRHIPCSGRDCPRAPGESASRLPKAGA